MALDLSDESLQPIDKRLTLDRASVSQLTERLHARTQRRVHPNCLQHHVEEAIEPVTNSLDHLHKKVDILLPNKKRVKDVRDPLDYNLYPRFMANAGNVFKRQHELKRAQLRVAYTILYYAGFRLNEIRNLTQKDIQKTIASSQFNIIQHKTNKAHIQVLPRKALEDLKKLNLEYEVIFEKYKYDIFSRFISHKDMIGWDAYGEIYKYRGYINMG